MEQIVPQRVSLIDTLRAFFVYLYGYSLLAGLGWDGLGWVKLDEIGYVYDVRVNTEIYLWHKSTLMIEVVVSNLFTSVSNN